MHCVFSVPVCSAALPAFYHALASRFGADMLLSPERRGDRGIAVPAGGETQRSIIGIAPVRELVVRADTDRNQIHDYCFDRPDAVLPATLGYISYTFGLVRYGIASRKPHDLPLGHLKQYAIQLHVVPDTKTQGRALVTCFAAEEATCRQGRRHGRLHPGEVRKSGSAGRAGVTGAPGTASDVSSMDMEALLRELETLCRQCGAGELQLPAYTAPFSAADLAERLRQSLTAEAYTQGVATVLEHIRNGDTYQLNLSTCFAVDMHHAAFDPLTLFTHLVQHNPAPFYAWLVSGTKRILSTSPERFMRVRDGEVLAQPIKGTLAFDAYRAGMERSLTQSAKESAELSMIVDLIRNDISTHCEYGSVCVARHKGTFTVDSLIQMYSDVRGTLRADSTCLDLLFDAFPGGSITGCPKRRTMRIIESLEPHCRDLYCGSIVCIENARTMDSSIAIRTGWYDVRTAILCFFAGSGIVIESIPEREYAETLAKAGKFLRALIR